MIALDAFHPIFIDLAMTMSFKILNSTASRPIFLQLIARPILFHKRATFVHTGSEYQTSAIPIPNFVIFYNNFHVVLYS